MRSNWTAHSGMAMKERKTGHWCSTGQGAGSVQDSGTREGEDDLDSDDDVESLRAKVRAARAATKRSDAESKRRRLALKSERNRHGNGDGGQSGPDQAVVMQFLTTMAKSEHQLHDPEAFVDLVVRHLLHDATDETDMDDVLDEAIDRFHYFVKGSKAGQEKKDLPGQGGRGNGDKNKGGPANQAELRRKYPALGGGVFGSRMRPYG